MKKNTTRKEVSTPSAWSSSSIPLPCESSATYDFTVRATAQYIKKKLNNNN